MRIMSARWLLAASTAITCSTPVLAQQAAAPAAAPSTVSAADPVASDIIVTAQRVEQRLQDVPISITVYNEAQINSRNIVNGTDLAIYTPSLSANGRFGNEAATFAIRGFTQENFTSPSVGVYFADVIGPRASGGTGGGNGAGPGQFFDLQNVQVLKGPQGTLFGRNTTGGAILIVPQKPTDRFEGYVEGSVGNYNMQRIQAVLNVPLSDTFKVRLGLDRMTRDGYVHNRSGVGPDNYDNTNYWAARLSIVANITPDLENYIIGRFSRSDTNGPMGKTIDANFPGCDNGVARPAPGAAENPPQTYGYPGSQNLNFPGAGFNPRTGTPFDTGVGANYDSFLAAAACGALTRQKAQGYGFWDVDAGNPDPFLKIKQWGVINTTTWRASDTLTVKNIISYQEFRQRQSYDVGNIQLFAPAGISPTNPSTPVSWFNANLTKTGIQFPWVNIYPVPGLDNVSQSTFTEELQLQGQTKDGKLNFVLGGYYEHADPIHQYQGTYSVISYVSAAPAPPFLPLGPGGALVPVPAGTTLPFLSTAACSNIAQLQCTPVNTFASPFIGGLINNSLSSPTFENIGFFGQATYKFTDQLSLTGGLRYTIDSVHAITATNQIFVFPGYLQCSGVPFPAAPVSSPVACRPAPNGFSQHTERPTWLIDLDYKPTPDLLLYAKYSRGYRQGNINASNSTPQAWGPEKVDAYEVGLKTTLRGGGLTGYFNIAGFYNDFSNQQLSAQLYPLPGSGQSPAQAIVNAGKSRIDGVEVDTLLNYSWLSLALGYTFLDTKLKSFTPVQIAGYLPALPGTDVGSVLPLSPKHKISITPSIRLPFDASVGKVTLSATYLYTSSIRAQPASITPSGVTDAFNILNLNLGWESVAGLPIDASAFVTNVTNEKYYTYAGGGWGTPGYDNNALGMPRMYGFRLRYRFGN